MEIPQRDLDIIEITKTLQTPGSKFIIALLNKEVEYESQMVDKITGRPVKDLAELNLHIAIRNKLESLRDNFSEEVFKMADETDLKFTANSPVHNRLLLELNV